MALASTVVLATLVAHPFAIDRAALAVAGPPASESIEAVEDDPVLGEAEGEAEGESVRPPPPVPSEAAAEDERPIYVPLEPTPTRKGTGLIVSASVTGTLAWVTTIGKMVLVRRCTEAVESASVEATGNDCVFGVGVGLAALTPTAWLLNGATFGLSAGAGAVRGRRDGVTAAWTGRPDRRPGVFIGVGASLLGLGIAGRIATLATFSRAVSQCENGTDRCEAAIRANFAGTQLAATSTSAGLGMMVYGLVYKGARRREERRLKGHAGQVVSSLQVTPQFDLGYTGAGLSGRF